MNESFVRMLSREQACKLLGISKRKLDDLIRHRQVPSFKIGRRRLFDPEHLQRWLHHKHEHTGAC